MNARQLEYAVMLARERSFSQVAEQLSISQPALSKHILTLEKELGVKLFDRNSIPLELTPAGISFVQQARQMLYRQEQLLRTMEQFKTGNAGQLTIGITPFRSSYLIPPVVRKVRERFPGIQVRLCEAGSEVLRRDAAEGKYDFALVNLPVDEAAMDCIMLEKDQLVLAVPNLHMHLLDMQPEETETDFGRCRELPFVVVGENQEMGRLFHQMCAEADFIPHIAAEAVGLTTVWAMVRAGVGAALLPVQLVGEAGMSRDITMVPIKNVTYTRQPAIVTKRGQYISPAARYAIELLSNKPAKSFLSEF